MSLFRRFIVLVSLLVIAGTPASAQSQMGAGAISGVVEDSSGGAIPGATVTVTSAGTGLVRTVATNNAGLFTIPVLPPGSYRLVAELSGFTRLERRELEVTVGSTVTLRLRLQVEGVAEAVSVTAEPSLIDSSRTEEATLIGRRQINDLPINGRRADQFALLAPGVTRDGRFGLLSYRGQSGVFNNFTLEGNDDNQAYFSEGRGRTRIASNISANAIQEFQVATSNFLP
ncbi:MAG TPA: carboxypeptidase-like regulatory domain-containing protein [Vicinamibacterales bacterium]|nr:carboxypeptidase-like regulatory domain-containing protein [Vicinamibacterales bacterium]